MKQNRSKIQKFLSRFKTPGVRFITVIPKNAFAYLSPLAQFGAGQNPKGE